MSNRTLVSVLFIAMCLCSVSLVSMAQSVHAQQVGDEFSSDFTHDEFYCSGAPALVGWTNGTISPAPTFLAPPPNAFELRKNARGRWSYDFDGQYVWIPKGDDFDPTETNPFAEMRPPSRSREHFPWSNIQDEFDRSDDVTAADLLDVNVKRWSHDGRVLSVYVSGTIERARNGKVKQLIDQSLAAWCEAIRGSLKYRFTNDFKQADIYFLQRGTANREWADNERFYSKTCGLYMVKVSMLERTVNQLPERQLKALLLHQSGHALGLIDHLSGERDAMSANVCSKETKVVGLTEQDKRQLKSLYWDGPLQRQATMQVSQGAAFIPRLVSHR